jgi:WD40 repeat protein
VISAGEDGFLEIWDVRSGLASERFQISPYSIIAMADRPGKDELCVVESDKFGLYRIGVWNFRERRNIFTLQSRDPISHVSYSMGGNFIIAARIGMTGLIFIDSASGELLQSPSLTGTVGLAVTGRSERNVLVYLTSGALSYWDLESGDETSRFGAPANLNSPVLFGNNRYLAGIGTRGLIVIHAASGEIIAQLNAVPAGSLLCSAGDAFICLVQRGAQAELTRYSIDRNGSLVASGQFTLPVSDGRFTVIGVSANGNMALGTSSGTLALTGMDGRLRYLTIKGQTRIIDAAVSGSVIAFLTDDGTLGFIPMNYSQLSSGAVIRMEANEEAYNRVAAFVGENGSNGEFIFWQDRNTRIQPVLRSFTPDSRHPVSPGTQIRSPIRSAVSFWGKILFLDSTGNISIVSPLGAGASRPFAFSSVGLMDAAFVDRDRIIIGRSAVSGNAPLMVINISNGETVPLPYSFQAAVTLHRGASGSIYGVVISSGEARTSILQLNLADNSSTVSLVEFHDEDTLFSLVESPGGIAGSLAATIGGEGAALYSVAGIQKLDRTPGLPLRLIDGSPWLIGLDMDGNICWHDSANGKILALFRLHPDGWSLQTERGVVNGS